LTSINSVSELVIMIGPDPGSEKGDVNSR